MSIKKISKQSNSHYCLFIAACFAIYFFWSVFFASSFDNFYGPDEAPRNQIVMYIVDNHSLPTGWEPELIMGEWGFSYGLDIKLPYLISALFVSIVSVFTDSSIVQLVAFRFVSVLSGTGIVVYSILISQKVFNSNSGKWIFIFLMSLLPQVIFLSSYFNLDIFSLFAVMIIIDAWLNGYTDNWASHSVIELGIGMGLCLVSYSFAYGFLVGSFVLYICWYMKNYRDIPFLVFIQKGLVMLLIVFIIGGWMLIRNYIVHDGDIFASHVRYIQVEMYADPLLKPSNSLRANGNSILDMLLHTDFIELSYRSLICVLGPMGVRGSIMMYVFYALVILIGFIAFFKYERSQIVNSVIPFGAISSVFPVIISIYYSWTVDYEPQGRYLITILPIIFLISSIGFESIISKSLTYKKQKHFVLIFCSFVVIFSLEAFIRCARYFGYF